MQPERWLESLVARDVSALDSRLTPARVYSQVPAFSASDRPMIDVLTVTRERRLAVIELKATRTSTCPCRVSITGGGWSGTTLAASSRSSATSPESRSRPRRHCCW